MSNRVYMSVHKVESVDIDGSSRNPVLGPWYEVCVFDDGAEFSQYVGHVSNTTLADLEDIFSPGGAIAWIRENEGDFDAIADWALAHGMFILDDWYSSEELQEAYLEEDNDD